MCELHIDYQGENKLSEVSEVVNPIPTSEELSPIEKFFLKENYVLSAIILNAIIIFILAFPSLENTTLLLYADSIFVLYFTIEAIIKIRKDGFKKYFSEGWNRFDLLIVIVSLPLLFENFLAFTNDNFHVVTIFRLFRLLRVIRFFRFVPNITHILAGLSRAFRATIFVFMILIFLNFIFAVLTTYLFAHDVPELFGNPIKSAFTIFQLFTLEGWNEVPAAFEQLAYSQGQVYLIRAYFAIIVLAGGIFGMSIANAIFVDEMTMDNNIALEGKIDQLQEQINQLQKLIIEQNSNNSPIPVKPTEE